MTVQALHPASQIRIEGTPHQLLLSAVLLMMTVPLDHKDRRNVSDEVIRLLDLYISTGGSLNRVGSFRTPLGPYHLILVATSYHFYDVLEWMVTEHHADVCYSYLGQTAVRCAMGCFSTPYLSQFHTHFLRLFGDQGEDITGHPDGDDSNTHHTPRQSASDAAHAVNQVLQFVSSLQPDNAAMLTSRDNDHDNPSLISLPLPFTMTYPHTVRCIQLIHSLGGVRPETFRPHTFCADLISATQHVPLSIDLLHLYQYVMAQVTNHNQQLTYEEICIPAFMAFVQRPSHIQDTDSPWYTQFRQLFVILPDEKPSPQTKRNPLVDEEYTPCEMSMSIYLQLEVTTDRVSPTFINTQLELFSSRGEDKMNPFWRMDGIEKILYTYGTTCFPLSCKHHEDVLRVILSHFAKAAEQYSNTPNRIAPLQRLLHIGIPEEPEVNRGLIPGAVPVAFRVTSAILDGAAKVYHPKHTSHSMGVVPDTVVHLPPHSARMVGDHDDGTTILSSSSSSSSRKPKDNALNEDEALQSSTIARDRNNQIQSVDSVYGSIDVVVRTKPPTTGYGFTAKIHPCKTEDIVSRNDFIISFFRYAIDTISCRLADHFELARLIAFVLRQPYLSIKTKNSLIIIFGDAIYTPATKNPAFSLLPDASFNLHFLQGIDDMISHYNSKYDTIDDIGRILQSLYYYTPIVNKPFILKCMSHLLAGACRNDKMLCHDFNQLLQTSVEIIQPFSLFYPVVLVHTLRVIGDEEQHIDHPIIRQRGELLYWLVAHHDIPDLIPKGVMTTYSHYFEPKLHTVQSNDGDKEIPNNDLSAGSIPLSIAPPSGPPQSPFSPPLECKPISACEPTSPLGQFLHKAFSALNADTLGSELDISIDTHIDACISSILNLFLFTGSADPDQEYPRDHLIYIISRIDLKSPSAYVSTFTDPFWDCIDAILTDDLGIDRDIFSTPIFAHLFETIVTILDNVQTRRQSENSQKLLSKLALAFSLLFRPGNTRPSDTNDDDDDDDDDDYARIFTNNGTCLAFDAFHNPSFKKNITNLLALFHILRVDHAVIPFIHQQGVISQYIRASPLQRSLMTAVLTYITKLLENFEKYMIFCQPQPTFPSGCLPHAVLGHLYTGPEEPPAQRSPLSSEELSTFNQLISVLCSLRSTPVSRITMYKQSYAEVITGTSSAGKDVAEEFLLNDDWAHYNSLFIQSMPEEHYKRLNLFSNYTIDANWFHLFETFLQSGLLRLYGPHDMVLSSFHLVFNASDDYTIDSLCYFLIRVTITVLMVHQRLQKSEALTMMNSDEIIRHHRFKIEDAMNYAIARLKGLQEYRQGFLHAHSPSSHSITILRAVLMELNDNQYQDIPSTSVVNSQLSWSDDKSGFQILHSSFPSQTEFIGIVKTHADDINTSIRNCIRRAAIHPNQFTFAYVWRTVYHPMLSVQSDGAQPDISSESYAAMQSLLQSFAPGFHPMPFSLGHLFHTEDPIVYSYDGLRFIYLLLSHGHIPYHHKWDHDGGGKSKPNHVMLPPPVTTWNPDTGSHLAPQIDPDPFINAGPAIIAFLKTMRQDSCVYSSRDKMIQAIKKNLKKLITSHPSNKSKNGKMQLDGLAGYRAIKTLLTFYCDKIYPIDVHKAIYPLLHPLFVTMLFYQLKHQHISISDAIEGDQAVLVVDETQDSEDEYIQEIPLSFMNPFARQHNTYQIPTPAAQSDLHLFPVNVHHPTILSALVNHPDSSIRCALIGHANAPEPIRGDIMADDVGLNIHQTLEDFDQVNIVDWQKVVSLKNIYPAFVKDQLKPTIDLQEEQSRRRQPHVDLDWYYVNGEGILWYILHHVPCPSIDDLMFLFLLQREDCRRGEHDNMIGDDNLNDESTLHDEFDGLTIRDGDDHEHEENTTLIDLFAVNRYNETILMHAILRRWPESALLFLIQQVGRDHVLTHTDNDGFTAVDYMIFCNTKSYAPAVVNYIGLD